MPDISKYEISVIEKKTIKGNHIIFISDLDTDQNNEEMDIDITPSFSKIMLYKGKGLIDQNSMKSRPLVSGYITFADHDSDGLMEIFLLTERIDSILDPFKSQRFILMSI